MKLLARAAAVAGTSLGPRALCRRALSTTLPLSRRVGKTQRSSKKPLKRAGDRIRRDAGDDPSQFTETRGCDFQLKALMTLEKILHAEETSELVTQSVGPEAFAQQAGKFLSEMEDAFAKAGKGIYGEHENPLYSRLLRADKKRTVDTEIKQAFLSTLLNDGISGELRGNMRRLADFRTPYDWFPATRTLQRTIHVHVGPTNSGKTYHALKALENAKSGVYAGPLRLLAVEVYERLRAKGHDCALVTGEEVRIPEDTDRYFISATVEMIPLNTRFDVAVIDEIQMMGDLERGNGWTTALLGVQAKEVHLCGEERTVNLIQHICASIGDKCVIHRYSRLNPLVTMPQAIGSSLRALKKGDAVVGFSRLALHSLKRNIEKSTGRRCAIIYGSLPPEVRKQQAALFNSQDNEYDFIVASDAIGMGLNLEIRRVVFESVVKFDGNELRPLRTSEIRQIGGRAGRYRPAQSAATPDASGADARGADAADKGPATSCGYVTTMERADLKSVRLAFKSDVPDIQLAVMDPPAGVVERFASYYPPGTPLVFILLQIKEMAEVGFPYRINIGREVLAIANTLEDIPLTIHDRMTFCYMPATLRVEGAKDVMRALARAVAGSAPGHLLSIPEIPLETLDREADSYVGGAGKYLVKLEALHVALNQYIWLSYRYAGLFPSQGLAFHVRSLVADRLVQTLDSMNFTNEQMERNRANKRRMMEKQGKAVGDDLEGEEAGGAGGVAVLPAADVLAAVSEEAERARTEAAERARTEEAERARAADARAQAG